MKNNINNKDKKQDSETNQMNPEILIRDNQEKVLRYLYDNGPSYASKIKDKWKMHTTAVTDALQFFENEKVLRSEWKKKPDIEIKNRNKAKYYEIVDREFVKKLLDKFSENKKIENSIRKF